MPSHCEGLHHVNSHLFFLIHRKGSHYLIYFPKEKRKTYYINCNRNRVGRKQIGVSRRKGGKGDRE